MLFNAVKGENPDAEATDRLGQGDGDIEGNSLNSLDQPMTPCPSAVEYVTPVFAKNYQGVWRYVVQIPYEGYFTQTVEVVKCLSNKCQFLQGSCLASPRWVSLLVAEIYYPDTFFPNVSPDQPIQGRDPIKVILQHSLSEWSSTDQRLNLKDSVLMAPAQEPKAQKGSLAVS